MRIANHAGRATLLVTDDTGIDVHISSEGRFGPSMSSVFTNWDAFTTWAATSPHGTPLTLDRRQLGAPSPEPRQVFAVGLNYRAHASEAGYAVPEGLPPLFTKFVSSFTGPDTTVVLPNGGNTDWEVELVAIIGRGGTRIAASDAWDHIAGVTIGQDISERITQQAGPAPQFSFGKSFPGFSPTGPWLVTPDELPNPNALTLEALINDIPVQRATTADLVFDVPTLIERLTERLTLYPGDVIFTGTPEGVGLGMTPQRFLQPGETLVSRIERIGEMTQTFITEPLEQQ